VIDIIFSNKIIDILFRGRDLFSSRYRLTAPHFSHPLETRLDVHSACLFIGEILEVGIPSTHSRKVTPDLLHSTSVQGARDFFRYAISRVSIFFIQVLHLLTLLFYRIICINSSSQIEANNENPGDSESNHPVSNYPSHKMKNPKAKLAAVKADYQGAKRFRHKQINSFID